ncbi:hypothetical protein SDC9_76822 [bioreactor metagenome]|uniref:Uncharacterized protein n=1 Tax=bioreactor metagenome TaxID=1076179 RepID=A0A644YW77_9ZZZZ
MGNVCHKFPPHFLRPALCRHVVDHHQHAALALPVEGSKQQLQTAAGDFLFSLQITGLRGVQHGCQGIQSTKEAIVVRIAAHGNGAVQHLFRGGIGMNDDPIPIESHNAVGHVQEKRAQFVALVFHFLQGFLKLARHIVEGIREDADLILGAYLDFSREIALRHPFGAVGQPLNGGNHGFGEQEGQQHGNDKSENQRLNNQHKKLIIKVLDCLAVVADINNVGRIPPGDRDGDIHIVRGHVALRAHLTLTERGQKVGGHLQSIRHLIVGPREIGPGVAVQNGIIAVPAVHAQRTQVGGENRLEH